MSVLVDRLRSGRAWDGWGMAASALCVVHCIVTPFAALLLPTMAANQGVTHGVLGVAVILFALLAFVPGMRTHGKRRVLVLGMIGVGLIWTALMLPEEWVGDAFRDGLTMAGGVVMVVAHVFNVVLCRRCSVCCSECGTECAQGASPG